MKQGIIVIFVLGLATTGMSQSALNKGPFYKNAKPWKKDKDKTEVFVHQTPAKFSNGLFYKNRATIKIDKSELKKIGLKARKEFVKGPKAKNKKH